MRTFVFTKVISAAFTLTTLGPTLDQIQAIIFSPTCATAGCHNGVTLAGGMNLSDADTSYTNLLGPMDMGVPSPLNGVLRVNPGDANTSYLIEKLEKTRGAAKHKNLAVR